MEKKEVRKYIAFVKGINFLTYYTIDEEIIEMAICKNITFRQPYSEEWNTYIKKTCLQVYPKVENPLLIFQKLYNIKRIAKPIQNPFK